MPQIPRHANQHQRAAALELVTESATVTHHEAMDRSRNSEVRGAIREWLAAAGGSGWLDEIRDGSEYDWSTLFDHLRETDASPQTADAVKTLAERIERPYPSLLRLQVDPDDPVDFSPGQYVTLRAHGTPRAYSIANAPSEDHLEFAIRRVPGGRLTSELFTTVGVGDTVTVRGPNGDMVLNDPSGRDVVFLATGTGVAPFKSMIDALFERGWDHHDGDERDVWLFLGCGWADDLPYHRAFRSLDEAHSNFHYVPTLTREPLLTDWAGETDYVQQVFVKYLAEAALEGVELPRGLRPYRGAGVRRDTTARIHPGETNLYACGITAMVGVLVRTARAVGVSDRNMQYEGFG
jgi:CDP-4-dehydro-6-deoxyglucose reductase